MSIILADNEQRKGQALFIHSILRAGYALTDRREQKGSVLAWYPSGRLRTLLTMKGM